MVQATNSRVGGAGPRRWPLSPVWGRGGPGGKPVQAAERAGPLWKHLQTTLFKWINNNAINSGSFSDTTHNQVSELDE